MRGEQATFNLEIKKKSGLSLNPDIHHSKVFSSGLLHGYSRPITQLKPFSICKHDLDTYMRILVLLLNSNLLNL